MTKINDKTADGLMEFCGFLVDKGYAAPKSMENWRTAVRTVLQVVEGDDFGSTDLSAIDLDDVLNRFETLTRGRYKPDSVNAYGARMRGAIEAYLRYVEDGTLPKRRKTSRVASGAKKEETSRNGAGEKQQPEPSLQMGQLIEFPFPLQDGQMARLHLPRRLQANDANRLSAFLRTLQLEGQKELPERTGEEEQAEAA